MPLDVNRSNKTWVVFLIKSPQGMLFRFPSSVLSFGLDVFSKEKKKEKFMFLEDSTCPGNIRKITSLYN